MSRYLKSDCCGARVVGMVDITVHPRLRVDGTFGPIVDSLADVKRSVRYGGTPSRREAYCEQCGEPAWESGMEDRS